jgi:hypothetical protein
MICEKCQSKEANSHFTYNIPTDSDQKVTEALTVDLCEGCYEAFKQEMDRFWQRAGVRLIDYGKYRYMQSRKQCSKKGRLKQEPGQAGQRLQDELKSFVRAWAGKPSA